jgi:hypothetical protein
LACPGWTSHPLILSFRLQPLSSSSSSFYWPLFLLILFLQIFRSIDSGSLKGFPKTIDECQDQVYRKLNILFSFFLLI